LNDNTTQRDHLMAALSAAEQITAASPIVPRGVTFDGAPFGDGPYSLVLSFHRTPETVAEFAAAFGLPVTYQESYVDGAPYVEARGELFGFQVRAYALGLAGDQERYAACASAAGLPVAWSAAVSV
jgi:hypothetical protein